MIRNHYSPVKGGWVGSLRDCNEKFTLAATMLYEYDIYTRTCTSTIYMVHYYKGLAASGGLRPPEVSYVRTGPDKQIQSVNRGLI